MSTPHPTPPPLDPLLAAIHPGVIANQNLRTGNILYKNKWICSLVGSSLMRGGTGRDGDPAVGRTSGLHSAHFSAESTLCLAVPPRTFIAQSAIPDLRSRRCIVLESSPRILLLFAWIKKCRSFGQTQDRSGLSKLLPGPSWMEPEHPGFIPTTVIMRSASSHLSVNALVPVQPGSVSLWTCCGLTTVQTYC